MRIVVNQRNAPVLNHQQNCVNCFVCVNVLEVKTREAQRGFSVLNKYYQAYMTVEPILLPMSFNARLSVLISSDVNRAGRPLTVLLFIR